MLFCFIVKSPHVRSYRTCLSLSDFTLSPCPCSGLVPEKIIPPRFSISELTGPSQVLLVPDDHMSRVTGELLPMTHKNVLMVEPMPGSVSGHAEMTTNTSSKQVLASQCHPTKDQHFQ